MYDKPGVPALTHLPIVDGVLPWWVVAVSFALAAAAVGAVLRPLEGADRGRVLARVGVTGGALVVLMSIPLGPGVHLSLSPLAGMMLGPAGGFLAAFLANATLAMFGHGGLTAIGLNGLFLGGQAALGSVLFVLLGRPLSVRKGAVAATAATLCLAAATGITVLRLLPMEPGGPGHGDHGPGTWGLAVVGTFALVAILVEILLTASVVGFLSRVRSDLLTGSA